MRVGVLLRCARRDNLNDAKPVLPQIPQEGRHDGSRARLRIVEQDDAFAGGSHALGDQLQFLLGRHLVPVAGPEIGAEHDDAARLQQVELALRGLEIGEAEERRRRRRRRDPVQGHLVGGDAAVDLALGLVGRDPRHERMRPGVVADGVALAGDALDHVRVFGGVLADQEEGRAHALLRQRRQHLRGGRRMRAVVEGQYDLVIGERQRLREALQSDARRGPGIDAQHPRGAERVLARAVRGLGRGDRGEGSESQARRDRGLSQTMHLCHCARDCLVGIA